MKKQKASPLKLGKETYGEKRLEKLLYQALFPYFSKGKKRSLRNFE
ncbi:hypothetical protein LC040_12670 [Bacillus tianshenii]|nr:hypothetical protein LC040_12670 [Bacillus tianshenii]